MSKVLISLTALFAISSLIYLINSNAYAVSLTSLSDTLTRLQKNTLSSHTILFILPENTGFLPSDTITIDFGEDKSKWIVDGVNLETSDFSFNDGTQRNITNISLGEPTCTKSIGLNDIAVGVKDNEGIITIKACGFYTPSDLGTEIILKIGKTAGGEDRIVNPSIAGSATISIIHQTGDKINSGKLAVPIMESDGLSVSKENSENYNQLGTVLGQQTQLVNESSRDYFDTIFESEEKEISLATCFSDNFTSIIPNF